MCLSASLEPFVGAREGTLASVTMIRRPPLALRDQEPYLVAIVRTDAGPFVTGRIRSNDDLPLVGARVQIVAYDGEAPTFERI